MTPALRDLVERHCRWVNHGLVRRTTAHVTAALLGILLITELLSFFGTLYLVREQQRQELNLKADAIALHFEETLGGWASAMDSLARNRIMANALLDSQGRDMYLAPFMREYDMRIDELLGLTLCDHLGRPLASTGVGDARCFGERPDFRGHLDGKRKLAFFTVEGNRRLLVLLVPVIYPTTNTAEGALVGRLDLTTWFEGVRHIPAAYRSRLHVANRDEALIGSTWELFDPRTARLPRLPAPLDGIGLELRIGRAEAGSIADISVLFLAHGLAALLLLLLGVFYARRTARNISQPILALVDTARGIADGRENLRADASRRDELGQLARDFNRMVDKLEAAKGRLMEEVDKRTAELRAEERRERDRTRELAAILNAMPALVMTTTTPDCQFVQVNRALRDMFPDQLVSGDAPVELARMQFLGLRHNGVLLAIDDWPLVKTAREGIEVSNFSCEVVAGDGCCRFLLGNALPLVGLDSQPAGAIAVFTDITHLRHAEAEVKEQEERYHRLFDLMPEGLCVFDGDLIHMVNTTMAQLAGFDGTSELAGQHVLSLVHVEDRPAFSAAQRNLIEGAIQPAPLQFRLIRRDGSLVHAEIVSGELMLSGRRVVQSIIRDVTSRREAEEKTQLAARVFESSQDGIFITDALGRIISVNPAFTQRTGYSTDDLLGKEPIALSAGLHDDGYYAAMWQAIASMGHWEGEMHNRHKDGGLMAQWMSISAVRDDMGGLRHYIAVLSDISERKVSAAHMAYLAQHDYLTGLPNRLLLRDRLGQAINAARRDKHEVAVLFVDLDGFKQVNDTYGHAVGDQLLKQVAHRMSGQLRAMDSVCRIGGDEFVVLLVELAGKGPVATVAAKLCEALARPYTLGALRISSISASIGIARFPGDGDTIDGLIDSADEAMYQVKRQGKNAFVFHDASAKSSIPYISSRSTYH